MVMTDNKKILLVDDSEDIAELVKVCLIPGQVYLARSIGEANVLLRDSLYDLILIDVGLPDGNGFDLCQSLNNSPTQREVPKIMLTAMDQVAEKVYAFNCGADDYITKPFNSAELKARVDRHLTRSSKIIQNKFVYFEFEFDMEFQRCSRLELSQKIDLGLTPTEFRLLLTLIRSEGRVLSRGQLEREAWKAFGASIEQRGIDTHIAHLRKKLGAHKSCLISVYGQGYSFKVLELVSAKKSS